jgi:Transposase DNA-binding
LASSLLCVAGMLNFDALLQDAPLPDKRLRDRAALLFQSLLRGQSANSTGLLSPADRTQESFTRAAYRFFDHDDVSLPALHAPVQTAILQLVSPGSRAFVAHDVSVLNYSGHERKEDLIPVGNERTWGYELYQALVVDSDGKPLGAAFTELHSSHGLHSSQSVDPLPFTDHLEQTERAVDAVELLLPGRQLVHLCDREFDDLQLLRHIGDRRYVIRCQHLSRLITVHGEQQSLRQHLERVELAPAGEVVRRYEQSTQSYQLYVGETVVTLHQASLRGVARKRKSRQPGSALRVRVVVSELRQQGHKPLRWVLLTNLQDSALSVVECYLLRWKIERLFYFSKIGFRLECWHQESAERIARRLLLVQLAAMAVYQLRDATDQKTVELMHKLAKLGGWSGRPTTPIGPTMLMRGALLFLATVQLLQLHSKKDLLAMARSLEPLLGPILRRRAEK